MGGLDGPLLTLRQSAFQTSPNVLMPTCTATGTERPTASVELNVVVPVSDASVCVFWGQNGWR
jgi:hypothetical protein